MATITELVEKHSKVPGDIKLYASYWGKRGGWFAPFFLAQDKWYGVQQHPEVDFAEVHPADFPAAGNQWELWQEPKRKRKMAPYLLRGSEGLVQLTSVFYETDIEAGKDWEGTRNLIVRRMTELEVEVDE